ncbi:MAG: DUF1569 domain-containing protein [Planctomycetales bacterium]|nr:DUF1569 domain-containing protein [Planctomycetales bacterium]
MTTASDQRRPLRFQSHTDVIADVEKLISGGFETRGKWTLAQILEHLALAIDSAYTGFDFTVPLLIRVFVGPFMKKKFVYQAMPSGFNFRKKTRLQPPADVDQEEAFAHLRRMLDRLTNEAPTQAHPLIGKLSKEEWYQLSLRHAELHLSFVHPTS